MNKKKEWKNLKYSVNDWELEDEMVKWCMEELNKEDISTEKGIDSFSNQLQKMARNQISGSDAFFKITYLLVKFKTRILKEQK